MTVNKKNSVTLKDIAEHCQVSLMAVSWAMRDDDTTHVSPATRRIIRAAARQLGYDANHSHLARRLRYSGDDRQQPLNHLVAVSCGWEAMETSYFIRLLHGIGQVLKPKRFALVTEWSLASLDDDQWPVVFARGELDGIFLVAGSVHNDLKGHLRQLPGFQTCPIVSLMEPIAGTTAVLANDRDGGRQLARHLLEVGHRHLAYIPAPNNYPHEERRKGYVDALRELNLDPDQHLVPMRPQAESLARLLPEVMRHLHAEHPQVTAILAGNDHMALRCAEAARELGWTIPGDLALAGYDDTHVLPGPDGENQLTTVRLPLVQAGRQAAEIMLEQIETRQTRQTTTTLPVELVVRQSSILSQRQA